METPVSYFYDSTWEGLLSAVFHAYQTKRWPHRIVPEDGAQLGLGEDVVHIATDSGHARRVEQGILSKMGSPALRKISVAFLSEREVEKGTLIYRFVKAGMPMGRRVYNAIAHPDILAVDQLCTHIEHEAHLFTGFTRFALMENGVYYAKICPKNSVVPLVMPHFSDRFSDQPFLVFDPVHSLAGVYDLREWSLVETVDLELPGLAEEEIPTRQLWKQFYHSVAILERINPKCRRTHMPKRYWGRLTEFMPDKAM